MLTDPIRVAFAAALLSLPLAAQKEQLQLRWLDAGGDEPVAVRVDPFFEVPARAILVLGMQRADVALTDDATLRVRPDLVSPLDVDTGFMLALPRALLQASLVAPIYVQAIAQVESDTCAITLLTSMLWRLDVMRAVPMPLHPPIHLTFDLQESMPLRWSLLMEADVPIGPAELRVVRIENTDAATRVFVRLGAPLAVEGPAMPPFQVLSTRASGVDPGDIVEVWLARVAVADVGEKYERVELYRTR